MIAFAKPDNVIAMPQKSNEWFTPSKYIEAARQVLGTIDLDPASCAEANMIVRASKFYTAKDNGLEQPWYGNVWLNPPYSNPAAPRYINFKGGSLAGYTKFFINKLLESVHSGQVKQAIICINADTCRTWFQPLWNYPICFAEKAIAFERKGQKPEHHFFGSCFVYLGTNEQRFIDIFSQFGTIAKRVSTPRQTVTPLSLWEAQW